jgi:hypothetical protein
MACSLSLIRQAAYSGDASPDVTEPWSQLPVSDPQSRQFGGSKARFILEFFVIVISILVAFGLDAWWDNRKAAQQARAQLETLHAEFTANHEDLAQVRRRLESMKNAVTALLPHISPTAAPLPLDSINTLMDLSFRLGTVEMRTGSVQALLASVDLAEIADPELKSLIASWPAEVAALRTQSGLLEQNREIILDYLHGRVPTLEIAHKTGQMGRYPHSTFTINPSVVQRDMRVEGLFGNRGMMLEDTDGIVTNLTERVRRALAITDRLLEG